MYQKKITSYHLLVNNMDLHQDEIIQMKKIEISSFAFQYKIND